MRQCQWPRQTAERRIFESSAKSRRRLHERASLVYPKRPGIQETFLRRTSPGAHDRRVPHRQGQHDAYDDALWPPSGRTRFPTTVRDVAVDGGIGYSHIQQAHGVPIYKKRNEHALANSSALSVRYHISNSFFSVRFVRTFSPAFFFIFFAEETLSGPLFRGFHFFGPAFLDFREPKSKKEAKRKQK